MIASIVGGGGGSGLEYETGVYTQSSASTYMTIPLNTTHTSAPSLLVVARKTTSTPADSDAVMAMASDINGLFGASIPLTSTAVYGQRSSISKYDDNIFSIVNSSMNSTTSTSSTASTAWWFRNNEIHVTSGDSSYKFSGGEYYWMAIWASGSGSGGGGGGGTAKNVQTNQSTSRTSSTALTSVNSLTCSTTGTYDVYWTCDRSSTSGTWSSRLYVNGTATEAEQTTWSNHVQTVHLTGVTIGANQTVAVYVKARGTNYYGYCPQLTIVQTS